jgi:hypothetical protein
MLICLVGFLLTLYLTFIGVTSALEIGCRSALGDEARGLDWDDAMRKCVKERSVPWLTQGFSTFFPEDLATIEAWILILVGWPLVYLVPMFWASKLFLWGASYLGVKF